MARAELRCKLSINTSQFSRAMRDVRNQVAMAGRDLGGIGKTANNVNAAFVGLAAGIGVGLASMAKMPKLGKSIENDWSKVGKTFGDVIQSVSNMPKDMFKPLSKSGRTAAVDIKTWFSQISKGIGLSQAVGKLNLPYYYKQIKGNVSGIVTQFKELPTRVGVSLINLQSKISSGFNKATASLAMKMPGNTFRNAQMLQGIRGIAGGMFKIPFRLAVDAAKTTGLLAKGLMQTIAPVAKTLFAGGVVIGRSVVNGISTAFSAIKTAALPVLLASFGAIGIALKGMSGIKGALDFGGNLSDMSARTGASTKNLTLLAQVAKDSGTNVETLLPSIQKFQVALSKGTDKGFNKTLKDIGLNVDNLKSLEDPVEQMQVIQKAMSGITDPAKRAAIAVELFGRSGGVLQGIFNDPEAFTNAQEVLGRQADLLGENADKFDKVSDRLSNVGTQIRGFFIGAASSMIGPLDKVTKLLGTLKLGDKLTELGEKIGKPIGGVIDAISNMAGSEGGIGNISKLLELGMRIAFKSAVNFLGGLLVGVFMALQPVIANVLKATFGVLTNIDFWKGMTFAFAAMGSELIARLMDGLKKPIAFIQAGFQLAAQKLINTLLKIPGMSTILGMDKVESTFEEMFNDNLKNGVKLGIGEGKTAEQWKQQAKDAGKIAQDLLSKPLGDAVNTVLSDFDKVFKNFMTGFKGFNLFNTEEDKKKFNELIEQFKSKVEEAKGKLKGAPEEEAITKDIGNIKKPDVDQWAKIGLFVGSGGNSVADSTRRTANNTAEIVKLIKNSRRTTSEFMGALAG